MQIQTKQYSDILNILLCESNLQGKYLNTYELNDNKASSLLRETRADLQQITESGYTPQLRRNFGIWSLLGIGFSLTNCWFGISASLVTGISSGGPMLIVYGLIIVAMVSMSIGITLSELASAMPNAGGQYYSTMKLAPAKYALFAAYFCGAFAWAGSVFTSASISLSIATSLVGMYVLGFGNTSTEPKTWQVFITYEVVNFFLAFCNFWDAPLPSLSKGALYVSLLSFIVITITVLSKASGEFQSAEFVFSTFDNNTGWTSSVVAFLVGLINPTWLFNGLDCACHLAEEVVAPEKDIPIAIIGTIIIGFLTSFIYSIAMFFSITNLKSIFESNTGVPILDIFFQVLKSRAGAIVLQTLIVLTAIGCNITSHTWQARLCWSFSRDNGLPGSRYWSKVNPKLGVPINAHIMSCCWVAVIGCIYMGSTTAYNALVTACVIFLLLSYVIPTIFLLIKGRNSISHGPFWFGKFGFVCNCILIIWTIFAFVFFSFPPIMPVTAANMNYVSVVIVLFSMYAVIYWYARGKYYFNAVGETDKFIRASITQQLSNQAEQLEMILSHSTAP